MVKRAEVEEQLRQAMQRFSAQAQQTYQQAKDDGLSPAQLKLVRQQLQHLAAQLTINFNDLILAPLGDGDDAEPSPSPPPLPFPDLSSAQQQITRDLKALATLRQRTLDSLEQSSRSSLSSLLPSSPSSKSRRGRAPPSSAASSAVVDDEELQRTREVRVELEALVDEVADAIKKEASELKEMRRFIDAHPSWEAAGTAPAPAAVASPSGHSKQVSAGLARRLKGTQGQ